MSCSAKRVHMPIRICHLAIESIGLHATTTPPVQTPSGLDPLLVVPRSSASYLPHPLRATAPFGLPTAPYQHSFSILPLRPRRDAPPQQARTISIHRNAQGPATAKNAVNSLLPMEKPVLTHVLDLCDRDYRPCGICSGECMIRCISESSPSARLSSCGRDRSLS